MDLEDTSTRKTWLEMRMTKTVPGKAFDINSQRLAQLYAAQYKHEQALRTVNRPFTTAIWSLSHSLMMSVLTKERTSQFSIALKQLLPRWAYLTFTLTLVAVSITCYLKLFSKMEDLFFKILPLGLLHSKHSKSLKLDMNKLATATSVKQITANVKAEIAFMRPITFSFKLAIFALTFVLPATLNYVNGVARAFVPAPKFSPSPFGLYFLPLSSKQASLFGSILNRQQTSIWSDFFSPYISALTGCCRTKSPLQAFKTQIKNALGQSAKVAEVKQKDLRASMVLIKLPPEPQNIMLKEVYLEEAYRILLDEGLPAFRTASAIGLGYCALPTKTQARIKQHFDQAMQARIRQDKVENKCIGILNRLSRLCRLPNTWDAHHGSAYITTEPGQAQRIQTVLEQFGLTFQRDQRTFAIDLTQVTDELAGQINGARTSTQYSSGNPTGAGSVAQPKPRRRGPRTIPIIADPISAPAPFQYPEKIHFRRISFNRADGHKGPVFPLNLPWLPQGRAYGYIHPRAIERVSTYLTAQQCQAPLASFSRASKGTTGTGIKTSSEAYKDIDGKNQTAAIKLKYTNNVRIWGRQVERANQDGEQRLLYCFDGPGFGH